MDRNEKLSEHFSRYEFECKGLNCCGHSAPIDMRLLSGLEEWRDILWDMVGFEPYVDPFSGFRCEVHNKEIGGAINSLHTGGLACDPRDKYGRISPEIMEKAARKVKVFRNGGIGIYDNFIHLDVRGYKARWDRRTNK